jgi:multisubunit Na+/H+ antiporter MnhC subunit
MTEKHQEDLVHIRSMMERSSRFISLSGLSGVFAGLSALLGGVYVYQLFKANGIEYFEDNHQLYSTSLVTELILTAFVILFFALAFGIFFTVRKSKKLNLPIWTSATKNMLFNLAIPLIAGAVFCFALVYHQMFILVAPSTLIFYGLALLNAEKYTYSDIKYLGFSEVVLGSIALFFVGYGLVFWILGFGILHIFYGLLLFKKYK